MKKFVGIWNVIQNKYLLTVIVFVVWIIFFDRNDLFTQYDRKQELKKLQTSTDFYENEIAETKKNLTDLNNDPSVLEKMARENFYLKRSDEEIFIIIDSTLQKK